MFSLYNRRRNMMMMKGHHSWYEEDDQHDRFNRRCPSKNYDKFPKKIRPRKPQACEIEDSPLTSRNGLFTNPGSPRVVGCTPRQFSCSFPFLPQEPTPATPSTPPCLPSAETSRQNSMSQRRVSSVARELDSLTAWLQRLRWNNGSTRSNDRHYARYDYTALEDEQSFQEKMEMEKKAQRGAAREGALLTCQYYLRNSSRYVLLEQLGDIGNRLDKFWFLVRDTNLKTERLLMMIPQRESSPINFSGATKKTLAELFLALRHPYIHPILDVDVKTLTDEEYVIVVLPFNSKGSLKDLIYKSRCQEEWQEKYRHRGPSGLPAAQVQRLGRHILEGLLFLQDRGFASFGHLHSGNVIVQNGVARLTGYENTLLGYSSRLHPIVKKKLRDFRDAIDIISFGHILFEMCSGYELNTAHPTSRQLDEIQDYPQVIQVLNFIFEQEDGSYPTIEEVSMLEYFRNLDLREMRSMPVPPIFQAKLSASVKSLLKDVRRYQRIKKYNNNNMNSTISKRSRSSPAIENGDSDSKSPSPATSSRSAKQRKRRTASNSTPSDATSSELTSMSSLLETPHAPLMAAGSEEYHTPPNTPPGIKSPLDDSELFITILTSNDFEEAKNTVDFKM